MPALGAILGLVLAVGAVALPSGDGTANLDTMNFKTNLVIIGSAFFVGSTVEGAALRIVRALREATGAGSGRP